MHNSENLGFLRLLPRGFLPFHSRVLSAAEPGGTQDISRVRILIVEDNLILAMNVENHLRAEGFEVVGVAESADQALAMAADQKPDLVVLDIRLPGDRDGVTTATILFESFGIRSIFASAHGEADIRARATAARPAGWITKPYTMSDLVDAVRAATKTALN